MNYRATPIISIRYSRAHWCFPLNSMYATPLAARNTNTSRMPDIGTGIRRTRCYRCPNWNRFAHTNRRSILYQLGATSLLRVQYANTVHGPTGMDIKCGRGSCTASRPRTPVEYFIGLPDEPDSIKKLCNANNPLLAQSHVYRARYICGCDYINIEAITARFCRVVDVASFSMIWNALVNSVNRLSAVCGVRLC